MGRLAQLVAMMFVGASAGMALLGLLVLLTGRGWNFFPAMLSTTVGALAGLRWHLSRQHVQKPFWGFTIGEMFVIVSLIAVLLAAFSQYFAGM